jgi:hypothetical protein
MTAKVLCQVVAKKKSALSGLLKDSSDRFKGTIIHHPLLYGFVGYTSMVQKKFPFLLVFGFPSGKYSPYG